MAISPVKKKRLSLQIIRVARIFECLHIVGECTHRTIHSAIGVLPPKPVCERTIRRDLESLEASGFVRSRVCSDSGMRFYSLETMAALRGRLDLVKRLTPSQLGILNRTKILNES